MPRWPVSEIKEQNLLKKMAQLQIDESDLIEEFIRGSGAGGQKINKTSSTVTLTHQPTGITVRCQRTRQQSLNRYYARVMLTAKIEEKVLGKKSAQRQAIEKIRRQKRKRSKRAKEKMLEKKKQQSEKKQLRKTPSLTQE